MVKIRGRRASTERIVASAPIGGRNNGCYIGQQVLLDSVATPRAKNAAQSTKANPTPTTEEKTTRVRMDLNIAMEYAN